LPASSPRAIHPSEAGLSAGDGELPRGVGVDLSQQGLLTLLRDFIAIPSVSSDDGGGQQRDVNACWRAARFVQSVLSRVGAEVRLVQGVPGSNPLVLGRLGGWQAGVPTVCLHAHYDVQPPGDPAAWASPPFQLTGVNGYLYARGASDNKGPLLAMIFSAVRYWHLAHAAARDRASGGVAGASPSPVPVNFVFVFEGEGENGSVGFRESILQNLDWFSGTALIVNTNNTWIGETVPCLTYGMRGLVKLRVEVEGAATDLHSGLDGGVSHEPLMDLCAMLAAMVEPAAGRIAVPGIYDAVAPLGPDELRLYQDLDFDAQRYIAARGLPAVYASSNVALTAVAGAHSEHDAAVCGHDHEHDLFAAGMPVTAASATSATPGNGSGERPAKRARVEASDGGAAISEPAAPAHGAAVSHRKAVARSASADALADRANTAAHGSAHDEPTALLPPPPPSQARAAVTVATTAAAAAGTATSNGTRHFFGSPPAAAASSSSSGALPPLGPAAALLLRRWREPSLTVHGVSCSAANDSIIPRKASAYISVRTVPNMTSAGVFDAVAAHLRSVFLARRSANKLTVVMTSHAAWWMQSPTAPHYQAAARAIAAHWSKPPIFVREGGTVRVTTFLEKTLGAPALHLPIGQSSDGPHLQNERIRLLNLVVGMRVLQALFGEVGGLPATAAAGADAATAARGLGGAAGSLSAGES
jgi:acetylornithine deacetylase/succinyl-diaminopimelate desuccinylase-like protein